MSDEVRYALRASWGQCDVPDAEHVGLTLENSRLRTSLATERLLDQAKGIVMGAQGSSSDVAEQVLVRTARATGLRMADLAQALVEVVTGNGQTATGRAVEVAQGLLARAQRPAEATGESTGHAVATTIDLRDRTRVGKQPQKG